MRTPTMLSAVVVTAAVLVAGPAVSASAHEPSGTSGAGHAHGRSDFAATRLRSLNGSGAHGLATVRLHGGRAQVTVIVSGLLARAPHAMHFHAGTQGRCPTRSADVNGDGVVSVTEGHPFYGHVATSLTTRGDTSPASALAIDRFSTAPHGTLIYQRTVKVDRSTAAAIRHRNAVVVVHGVDSNRSGTYDGALRSDLDPALPMEATAPAACGTLHPLT